MQSEKAARCRGNAYKHKQIPKRFRKDSFGPILAQNYSHGLWEASGMPFGLGSLWECFWCFLGASWVAPGSSCEVLGVSWGLLEALWEDLSGLLGSLGGLLGSFGGLLGLLASSWGDLEAVLGWS